MSAPCCPAAVAATWIAAVLAVVAAVVIGFAVQRGEKSPTPTQPPAAVTEPTP